MDTQRTKRIAFILEGDQEAIYDAAARLMSAGVSIKMALVGKSFDSLQQVDNFRKVDSIDPIAYALEIDDTPNQPDLTPQDKTVIRTGIYTWGMFINDLNNDNTLFRATTQHSDTWIRVHDTGMLIAHATELNRTYAIIKLNRNVFEGIKPSRAISLSVSVKLFLYPRYDRTLGQRLLRPGAREIAPSKLASIFRWNGEKLEHEV